MEEQKYIPIWEFAKRTGISMASIYRWIKERRLKETDYKRIEKTVTRTLIREDLQVIRKDSGKVDIL